MQVDIRKYFTFAAVAAYLEALPELKSPIIDLIYSTRPTHPLPVLGVDELAGVASNVPVVRRGTAAHPLSGDDKSITYLEPQPVNVSSFLGAKELNDLKLLDNRGMEFWAQNKIDNLRRAVRATTEAIAAQSLTGKISYPMKTTAGLTTYDVDFGRPLSLTPATQWDAGDIVTILGDLIAMQTAIQSACGYGARVAVLAGKTAFLAVAKQVLAVTADHYMAANVSENAIVLPVFTMTLASSGYKNLNDKGKFVPSVADKSVIMVALDAPFKLFYCAIDDVDAGLKAMPFFTKTVKMDNPSGFDLIGISKPIPVPVVRAICTAEVVA